MSDPGLPEPLRRALERVAGTRQLLVASDYDGTLAPIVADPDRAFPDPRSIAALDALSTLPDTTAVALSGRALRDLAALSGLTGEVHLIGSHGAELGTGFDGGIGAALSPSARSLHDRLRGQLAELVAGRPGVGLEVKPASIAVHVRQAPPDVAESVLAAVRDGPAGWDGVDVTEGKAVLELAVVRMDKGAALELVRERVGASAVVFLGDDVTDEKAFARLSETDVGVKVGAGDTAARYRVEDPRAVTTTLELLLRLRHP